MEALNKRKMMLAISVSLAAYAFAISGCGKKSDDSDTAAVARVAAMKKLQGSWISTSDSTKTVHSLKIVTNLMTFKKFCSFPDKETLTSKVEQTYIADSKVVNFSAGTTNKDKADCVLTVPAGEVKYAFKGDELVIAVGPDADAQAKTAKDTTSKDKTKESEEIVGLKFTRSTEEKLAALEEAAKKTTILPTPGNTDKKAPVTAEEQAIVDAAAKQFAELKGKWLYEGDDENVKAATKEITKRDYSLIDFNDSTSFTASKVCTYKRSPETESLGSINSVGQKINITGTSAENKANQSAQFNFVDATSFKITRGYNRSYSALEAGQIALKDLTVTDCRMSFPEGLVHYDITGDTLKLTLPKLAKDNPTEKEEILTFHRAKDVPADINIIKTINAIAPKAEKSNEIAVKKADEKDAKSPADALPKDNTVLTPDQKDAAPAAATTSDKTLLAPAPIDAGISGTKSAAPDSAPAKVSTQSSDQKKSEKQDSIKKPARVAKPDFKVAPTIDPKVSIPNAPAQAAAKPLEEKTWGTKIKEFFGFGSSKSIEAKKDDKKAEPESTSPFDYTPII
jgi:hypothetical protein